MKFSHSPRQESGLQIFFPADNDEDDDDDDDEEDDDLVSRRRPDDDDEVEKESCLFEWL